MGKASMGNPAGMEAKFVGFPWGRKQMLQDSREDGKKSWNSRRDEDSQFTGLLLLLRRQWQKNLAATYFKSHSEESSTSFRIVTDTYLFMYIAVSVCLYVR